MVKGKPTKRRALVVGYCSASLAILSALLLMTSCASTSPSVEKRTRAPRLSAPVINERMPRGVCPSSRKQQQTTRYEIICKGNAIRRGNIEINVIARRIFSIMPDREIKEQFVQAERAWIRYRRSSCRVEADIYQGGSEQPVMYEDCVVRRNRTHISELKPFMKYLERIWGAK